MKNRLFLFTLLIACTNFIYAQDKRNYSFFAEVSVFRFAYEFDDMKDNLSNARGPVPDYEHVFDKDRNLRSFRVSRDTVFPPTYYNKEAYGKKDFRHITLGISRPVLNKKIFKVSHGLAISYSRANSYLGIVYADLFMLDLDSTDFQFKDSFFELHFHEQSKRIGLTYDVSGTLKIAKWFHFSFNLRNNVNYNYDDKLFVQYRHGVRGMPERKGDRVCYFICSDPDIRLYRNEKPDNTDYTLMENKPRLQWDMSLYAKPEFILGKNKLSSIYFFYGVALKSSYGKEYRAQSNYKPSWGIGVSRVI